MNKIMTLRTLIVVAICAMLGGSAVKVNAAFQQVNSEGEYWDALAGKSAVVLALYDDNHPFTQESALGMVMDQNPDVAFLKGKYNTFAHLAEVYFKHKYMPLEEQADIYTTVTKKGNRDQLPAIVLLKVIRGKTGLEMTNFTDTFYAPTISGQNFPMILLSTIARAKGQ